MLGCQRGFQETGGRTNISEGDLMPGCLMAEPRAAGNAVSTGPSLRARRLWLTSSGLYLDCWEGAV